MSASACAQPARGAVLLDMLVEIGDGRSGRLMARCCDDPRRLAESFGRQHGIGERAVRLLEAHIEYEVSEAREEASARSAWMRAAIDAERPQRARSRSPASSEDRRPSPPPEACVQTPDTLHALRAPATPMTARMPAVRSSHPVSSTIKLQSDVSADSLVILTARAARAHTAERRHAAAAAAVYASQSALSDDAAGPWRIPTSIARVAASRRNVFSRLHVAETASARRRRISGALVSD